MFFSFKQIVLVFIIIIIYYLFVFFLYKYDYYCFKNYYFCYCYQDYFIIINITICIYIYMSLFDHGVPLKSMVDYHCSIKLRLGGMKLFSDTPVIYIYIYTYIHTYIPACLHIYVYIYIYARDITYLGVQLGCAIYNLKMLSSISWDIGPLTMVKNKHLQLELQPQVGRRGSIKHG